MQNQFDPRTTTGVNPAVSVGVPRAARDAGLRSYMLSVYNYMASGVLLTGIVALAARHDRCRSVALVRRRHPAVGGDLRPAHHGHDHGLPCAADVDGRVAGLLLGFRDRDGRFDVRHLRWSMTGRRSRSASSRRPSAFLVLSLWGYTTKRDLSGFGTFLIMGVVGLFVVMLATSSSVRTP